jgi:hypothetical protein
MVCEIFPSLPYYRENCTRSFQCEGLPQALWRNGYTPPASHKLFSIRQYEFVRH